MTILELIQGALRLLGQLAEGETLTADQSQDCLTAFNQMLDSWSTESLFIYAGQDQSFSWTSGQATRTIGPTGNFVGERPVDLALTWFTDSTGITYPVTLITEREYQSIAYKAQTGDPYSLWINPTHPNATLTVSPVPTRALTWHFISGVLLAQADDLTTELAFPPGYLRAFRYNLACEMAPEYGKEPTPTVQRIARESIRNIKRINQDEDVMDLPLALVGCAGAYDINQG